MTSRRVTFRVEKSTHIQLKQQYGLKKTYRESRWLYPTFTNQLERKKNVIGTEYLGEKVSHKEHMEKPS